VNGAPVSPSSIGLGQPASGGSLTSVTVTLAASARQLSFQAVDAAGNVGAPASLSVPGPGQTSTGGGQPVGLPAGAGSGAANGTGNGAGSGTGTGSGNGTGSGTPGGQPRRQGPCPSARGPVRGRQLAPLRLELTRRRARQLGRYSTHGKRYQDFFCQIRAGYASPRLLRSAAGAQRRRLRDRIVIILTANRGYAIRGIVSGTRLRGLAGRLRAQRFEVGRNTWYLFADGASRGVLKVRRGVIEELGIAERSLTRTRAMSRLFLRSFF